MVRWGVLNSHFLFITSTMYIIVRVVSTPMSHCKLMLVPPLYFLYS